MVYLFFSAGEQVFFAKLGHQRGGAFSRFMASVNPFAAVSSPGQSVPFRGISELAGRERGPHLEVLLPGVWWVKSGGFQLAPGDSRWCLFLASERTPLVHFAWMFWPLAFWRLMGFPSKHEKLHF